MSLHTLEKAILEEARNLANNPKLKKKDLMEWSTGDLGEPIQDEVMIYLPKLRIYVFILKIKDKRAQHA